MQDNYIKSLEHYKKTLEKGEFKDIERHSKRFAICKEIANNITVYELEVLHYLRIVANDEDIIEFLKQLYEIKLDLKNLVLREFKLFSLLEPINYNIFNEDK